MAVGVRELPELHPVAGVYVGTTAAGIRKPGRKDLVVFELAEGAQVAGVFTRNLFCAAPVQLAKRSLADQQAIRYFLINTGNANAGTGAQGMRDAEATCAALAQETGVAAGQVLPFSTGVIGEPLPVARLVAGLPDALATLSATGWSEAAQGILTTDTVAKGSSRQVEVDGQRWTFTGIAKGSGMIRPDMATMLAFIATDAAVEPGLLRACLREATETSFNRITVDGDTSTNDACMLVATGKSTVPTLNDRKDPHYAAFMHALTEVCRDLAQQIVRDGEGATKFVSVQVEQGASSAECLQVAYTVAHSPLVKTALFASDPNWGRILAAVGRAGFTELDLDAVEIWLDEVRIVRDGGRDPDYSEAQGQRVMDRDELTIRIVLARGSVSETVWTTDFSHDYVRINAEYRS